MNNDSYIYTPDPHYHRSYRGYTRDRITLTGYNFERDLNELRLKLSVEKPEVFVSHKSDDTDTAQEVAETIAKSGLTVYLDVLDSNIAGDDPELVDYINAVISCCNSLIAVVSRNTVHSWWVPLEIGIAITRELHLGSFLVPTSRYTPLTLNEVKQYFPSYLWRWPVLTSTTDLGNWCKEHKKEDPPRQFYESLKQQYPSMFKQG